MKLILHDSLATAPLIGALQQQWIESTVAIDYRSSLTGSDVRTDEAALIPSAEIALLTETHMVVADVAVIFERGGMTAMRVPVRPDEVEQTPVWLNDVSGTAEILARATIEPFYGIPPALWTREPNAEAQVVVVDGAAALAPIEGGFTEDLVRAWFILTGQPVVSHLFVVPKQGDSEACRAVMRESRMVGHERRKDLRKLTAERFAVDREKLIALAELTRYEIGESERRALLMLLQHGNKGSAYPYVWQIDYAGD